MNSTTTSPLSDVPIVAAAGVDLFGSGEMLPGLVLFVALEVSPEEGGLLPVFAFAFESEGAFTGFEDVLGVVFLPSEPPNRSDSMSSKPCSR